MIRRLNRFEYNNTVRDLFDVAVKPADTFPADGAGGGGFDNNADTLFIPPILILTTLATFAYSVMSVSQGLRTIAILMFPVTVSSFLAAPLFMMLRARRSDEPPPD